MYVVFHDEIQEEYFIVRSDTNTKIIVLLLLFCLVKLRKKQIVSLCLPEYGLD